MADYGIRLNADSTGLVGATDRAVEAQDRLQKSLKNTAETATGAAAQSKNFVEDLKRQQVAAGETADSTRLLEMATNRLPPALQGAASSAGPYGIAILALGAALYEGVKRTEQFEGAALHMQAVLSAQGRGMEVSGERLRLLTREVALMAGMTTQGAEEVIAAYTRMRAIGGEKIQDLAKITADFAAVTGQTAPAAAAKLAQAFADPAKGAKELDQQFNLLTASQLLLIQRLSANGDVLHAQEILYDSLRDRMQGLAHRGMTPLEQSADRLSHAWPTLMQRMGDTGSLALVSAGFTKIVDSAAWLVENADKIAMAAVLISHPFLVPAAIAGSFMQGAPGMQDVYKSRGFEGDARDLQAAQGAGAAAKAQDQVKAALGLAGRYDTIGTRRIELEGAATQLQSALGGTAPGSPEYQRLADGLKAVNEQIAKLDESKITKVHDDFDALLKQSELQRASAELRYNSTEKVTQAEARLAEIEAAYSAGMLQGNAAKMDAIRLNLLAAAADEKATDARERDKKASEEATKAYNAGVEQQFKSIASLEEHNTKLAEHNQEIGKTKSQIDLARAAQAEMTLADLENQRALAASFDSQEGYVAILDARIAAQKSLIQLQRDGAVAEASADSAKKAGEEWKHTSDNIERSLTDALMHGFDKGKTFAQNLGDTLVAMFKTMVLEPIVRPIAQAGASLVTGAMQSIGGSLFGGGSGGGMGNILSLGSSGYSAATGNSLLGSLFGGGAAMANATNAAAVGGVATGAFDVAGISSGAALGGIGAALPWVGGALAVGSMLGLFGGGGGPKTPMIELSGGPGSYQIGQDNMPGGEANLPQIYALNARLNDPTQFDQSVLAQFSNRGMQSMGGDIGSALQAMLQMIEPAHQAAMQLAQQAAATVQASNDALMGRLAAQGAFVNAVQGYQNGLSVSQYLAPMDRLSGARSQFESTLAAAQGGDATAIQALDGSAQQLLAIGRDVYASGPQFADLMKEVNREFNDALKVSQDKQIEIAAELPVAIKQASQAQIDATLAQTATLSAKFDTLSADVRRLAAAVGG